MEIVKYIPGRDWYNCRLEDSDDFDSEEEITSTLTGDVIESYVTNRSYLAATINESTYRHLKPMILDLFEDGIKVGIYKPGQIIGSSHEPLSKDKIYRDGNLERENTIYSLNDLVNELEPYKDRYRLVAYDIEWNRSSKLEKELIRPINDILKLDDLNIRLIAIIIGFGLIVFIDKIYQLNF